MKSRTSSLVLVPTALCWLFACHYALAKPSGMTQAKPAPTAATQARQKTEPEEKKPMLAFEKISSGDKSGVKLFQTAVIQNKTEWDALWSRHDSKQTAPGIDFEHNTVLAVFGGQKPSAGYQIEITQVNPLKGGGASVIYRLVKPAPGKAGASVMSQPFIMIKTEKLSGSIGFNVE